MKLTGKVVMVTGAAKGLGKAYAEAALARGAKVGPEAKFHSISRQLILYAPCIVFLVNIINTGYKNQSVTRNCYRASGIFW